MKSLRRRASIRGEVGLHDLLLLNFILLSVLVGSAAGSRFGSPFGVLGGIVGLIIGAVAGMAAAFVALFTVAVALEPFGRLWRGTVRPCLKHGPFGRWRRDAAQVRRPGLLEKVEKACERLDQARVPGWLMPIFFAALHVGVAAIAVPRELIAMKPVALSMAAGLAAWGFIVGYVVWWKGSQ